MSIQSIQQTKLGPIAVWATAMLVAWLLAQATLQGTTALLMVFAIFGAVWILLAVLKDWRNGMLFFLTWLLFEDLVRKYLGNNMAVYFAKDVFVIFCCLSFFSSRAHKRILHASTWLFLPFLVFFCWGFIEVFNPNSPSLWFGLLGLKLYFGYVPLFFLGYALFRNEADLRRFLIVNMVIAALIALLGVTQAITGRTLLAPTELAPEIRELGSLMRNAPVNGQRFLRPPSVFVSDGRFGGYLLLSWLLGLGAAAYFFVKRLPGRMYVIAALALVMTALVFSGVRSSLMWAVISVFSLAVAYAREMGFKVERSRIIRAVAAIGILAIFTVFVLSSFYPEALNSRLAFYEQTLLPSSPNYELSSRLSIYPVDEFLKTFDLPNWPLGNGIGTSSLGTQYVTRFFGVASTHLGVESGFGNLILEMGIPGLLLWLLWSCSLLAAQWTVVRQLRGTALFPLGFVIFWFSLITLIFGMANGLTLENYITNAYLFLLCGALFSLPLLIQEDPQTNRHTRPYAKAASLFADQAADRSLHWPS